MQFVLNILLYKCPKLRKLYFLILKLVVINVHFWEPSDSQIKINNMLSSKRLIIEKNCSLENVSFFKVFKSLFSNSTLLS